MKRDTPNPFDAMRASLKAGVTSVSVPQLFETPVELAVKAAKLARIEAGHTVLEPSAGTGRLIDAALAIAPCVVEAVEINAALASRLAGRVSRVHYGDFLEIAVQQLDRWFDRVIMNPPFGDGADVKHIRAALTLLRPGGRLVAFCANGPRQRAAFKASAETWEDLPAGAFRGTNVGVALFMVQT